MSDAENIWPERTYEGADLSCRRGGRSVFAGLSFTAQPSEMVFLKGKNGSGKTTLLRVLAGLLKPESGSLLYGGERLDAGLIAASGHFLYSGHQHGLKKMLTLRENSSFLYELMSGKRLDDDTLFDAAAFFGLTDLLDQPVKYFSSGQLHRAALMRFCFLKRPVWLMDEPTVGLDSDNRTRLNSLMSAHLQCGGLIIAASHDPLGLDAKVLDMADYAPTVSEEGFWS